MTGDSLDHSPETRAASLERAEIPGSERIHAPAEPRLAAADPLEVFRVTIVLRRAAAPGGLSHEEQARRLLAGERVDAPLAASSADVARVTAFAEAHGLRIVESIPAEHRVVVEGTAASFNAAFGVSLGRYQGRDRTYRGYEGTISVPGEVRPLIDAVLGLEDRPVARHGPVPT